MINRKSLYFRDNTVSIIIVLYNNKAFIENAIQSVINQSNANTELIIIDGGSTDGSKEIVEKYRSRIAFYVSEPDGGIYEAMNKGIEKATGKWIYFLGSDDLLEPNVLSQIIPYMDDKYVMVYGDIMFNNGRRVPSFLNSRTLLQNTIHHQGAFYKRSLFDDFRYNTQLKILSDYELNLKIYKHRLPTQRLPMIIARCQEGGASSHLSTSLRETNEIRANFVGNGIINRSFSLLLRMYYLQKQIRALIVK